MGLDFTACCLLRQAFPARRVLSLGYPDMLLSRKAAKALYGVDLRHIHPQNDDAKRRHSCDFDLIDAEELFREMGSVLTCVDYKVLRGNEVVADLNYPCDFGEFDLVIDPGTLEHCFNLPQAALNVASVVVEGGRILHCNPISMVNHGFYMLSPTWYADWYGQNGWTVEKLIVSDGKNAQDVDPVARVSVGTNLSVYALAKRTKCQPMKWPIQTKYLRMQGA